MRVSIIVNFGFPGGMASTSRARHLAMGLKECGSDVEIIVPKPTEVKGHVLNSHLFGKSDGIGFRYTSASTVIPGNFILRRWAIIAGYLKCAGYLFRCRRDTDAVILYLREISGLAFLAIWCRLWGISTILEICEWPSCHRNNSLKTKLQNWLLTTGSFYFVDSVIAISSYLSNKVSEFTAKTRISRPLLVVPILVKAENYQCSGPYNSHGELFFCGILDQTEIILFLLEVMSELKRRGNGRKLNITGKAFIKGNLTLIQSRIVALGLSDLVELSGYLTEDELKRFYCRASVLLAPLPSGERSIARFPNKIGEYLASGRPVVTTAIGDIPNYLTEGESAFLVKPDDVVGFADAIIRILNNPGQAEQIGKNGATVAAKHFDPKANGKRITDLIKTLRAKKKSR